MGKARLYSQSNKNPVCAGMLCNAYSNIANSILIYRTSSIKRIIVYAAFLKPSTARTTVLALVTLSPPCRECAGTGGHIVLICNRHAALCRFQTIRSAYQLDTRYLRDGE